MSFTLRFSGHETFALRYGWLNKSYNSLDYKEKNEENLVVDLKQIKIYMHILYMIT